MKLLGFGNDEKKGISLSHWGCVALQLVLLVGWVGCASEDPVSSESPPAAWSPSFGYAAIGASDAVGVGALPFTEGYVYKLADRISTRRAEVQLLNVGNYWATVSSLLSGEIPQVVSFDPDLATIWVGPNDLIFGRSAADFSADLSTLLQELHSSTTALLFLANLIDLTKAPRFRTTPDPDVTSERIADYNASIRNAGATNGCTIVPLSEIVLHDSLFSEDGFHPNNKGYLQITEKFWADIAPYI